MVNHFYAPLSFSLFSSEVIASFRFKLEEARILFSSVIVLLKVYRIVDYLVDDNSLVTMAQMLRLNMTITALSSYS